MRKCHKATFLLQWYVRGREKKHVNRTTYN